MLTSNAKAVPQRPIRAAVRARLFCLPHAGGSAAAYRQLANFLPEWIEVVPLELPGRGTRLKERFATCMEHLVVNLARTVKDKTQVPFAIFGHSMGALVAFELNRFLSHQCGLTAHCLFVSAMRAPHLRDRRLLAGSLSDAELLDQIIALGGVPPEIWKHSEMIELMLATIRADISICESYSYEEHRPLATTINAFGGERDPYVTFTEIQAWRSHTASAFRFTSFAGGHFFIDNVFGAVAGIIESRILQVLQGDLEHATFQLAR